MLNKLQQIIRGDVEHALLHLWSDQLSEAEAAAIRRRVRSDPKYREEFNSSLEVIASMEDLAGDSDIQEGFLEYRRLLREHGSKRKAVRGIAASLLLTIGAALTYFSPWSGPDESHLQKHFTRIGEQQTIELDDGSVVTLNTGGRLAVDYSGPARRIVLERGEAYFEVTEDPRRPFTVDLGVRSVTAVGTAFNIRKLPEHYQVAVIEGAVSVHELTAEVSSSRPPIPVDGQPMVLTASGQQRVEAGWVAEFDVGRSQLTAYRPESMERYEGWRGGMLRFYREPLYQVVQELNRYTRKKILIEDTSVMELSVYTAVSIDDIDSALSGLEKLLPIEVTRHYDRIVITGSAGN